MIFSTLKVVFSKYQIKVANLPNLFRIRLLVRYCHVLEDIVKKMGILDEEYLKIGA